MLIVPEVFFDYCRDVGVEYARIPAQLIAQAKRVLDLKKLSRFGVEIFFTQVFRHAFPCRYAPR